jgi:hypothetical protein
VIPPSCLSAGHLTALSWNRWLYCNR